MRSSASRASATSRPRASDWSATSASERSRVRAEASTLATEIMNAASSAPARPGEAECPDSTPIGSSRGPIGTATLLRSPSSVTSAGRGRSGRAAQSGTITVSPPRRTIAVTDSSPSSCPIRPAGAPPLLSAATTSGPSSRRCAMPTKSRASSRATASAVSRISTSKVTPLSASLPSRAAARCWLVARASSVTSCAKPWMRSTAPPSPRTGTPRPRRMRRPPSGSSTEKLIS